MHRQQLLKMIVKVTLFLLMLLTKIGIANNPNIENNILGNKSEPFGRFSDSIRPMAENIIRNNPIYVS